MHLAAAGEPLGHAAVPTPMALPQEIGKALEHSITVLRPYRNEAEWWAGAPSVVRDDQGTFWMAARMLTDLGFTFDLEQVVDLTPKAPLVGSATPSGGFHTWRYSSWLWVEDALWAYAEVVNPAQAHEVRLFRFPRGTPRR